VAACRICGNAQGNAAHFPLEMMFGSREAFEYLECARCGCLQIATIPADLGRHYPSEGYYSYKRPKDKRDPAWLLALRRQRTRHWLGEFSPVGAALAAVSKRNEHFDWFRRAGVRLDSRILDVGCGAGKLLLQLQRDGFRSLLGADPFLEKDLDYGNGVRILRRGIETLEGEFDFLMLHHSFEHMPDGAAALAGLRRRMAPGATLLVRIPVADCHARRKYGVNWMAWDAPRHLYLHTRQSMALLAEGAGLRIAEVTWDSNVQQFSSSELYLRGVPYVEHGKYRPGGRPDAFTGEQWAAWAREAEDLNRRGEGDTACYYLRAA